MSEKYKNIDDLFRDKFENFEPDPPEHIWENIKQGIQDNNGGGSGKSNLKGGIAGISTILLLVGLFSIYQLYFNAQEISTVPEVFISSQNLNSDSEPDQNLLAINSLEADELKQQKSIQKEKGKKDKKQKLQQSRFDLDIETPVIAGKNSLVVNKSDTPLKPSQVNLENANTSVNDVTLNNRNINSNGFVLVPGDDSELLAMNNDKYIPQHSEQNTTNEDLANKNQNDNAVTEETNPSSSGLAVNPEIKSDYGKKNSWAFGLYFTPEMNFYPDNDILNNRSYSLDVQAMYKFSNYFIQSGLGISMTTDDGNYKINYNKYLGSYDYVYDVTFDTAGNQVTPIYHTEPMKVYDSVNHINISPTKSKYSYLQIPLLFGYGNESKRFGWFVKAGPSISILVNENISDYTMSDAKILNVDSEMPGRIKTNWQIVLSGGLSYRISNNISLAAEPMFRYYIKSAYENNLNTTKRPYSIGLRLGLLINF
ncbi:MAG: outer membrane beta-barrel protein [Bacteroidales bacterium]